MAHRKLEILQLEPISITNDSEDSADCCGPECCHDFIPEVLYYTSPVFWLWLTIVTAILLTGCALTLACSCYLAGKWQPVQPWLRVLASGPVQTTEYAQGIIVPRISYRHKNVRIIVEGEQIISENLSIKEMLSHIEDGSKIISEVDDDSSEMIRNSEVMKTNQSVNFETPIATVGLHLSPAYVPMKRVPQVWDRRYTPHTFERTVFPPGYIDI